MRPFLTIARLGHRQITATPLLSTSTSTSTIIPYKGSRTIMVPPSVPTDSESKAEASTPRARSRSPTRVPGPVETSITQKLISAFEPSLIRVSNDSSKHKHHSAMRAVGGGNGETHFAVHMVSAAFSGKTPIARHRLVNALLKDEFDLHGLHALSLRLKTPGEWEREGGDAGGA